MFMPKHSQVYTFSYNAPSGDQGEQKRLDLFLTNKFPDSSRSLLQQLIKEGHVQINNKTVRKTGTAVEVGDAIIVKVPAQEEKVVATAAVVQSLGVTLVYQTEAFAIVEKPAGLVTHAPHIQSKEISLCDWVVATFNTLEAVGYLDRPGIVHRLDKETSGLMIIPLTAVAHAKFSAMFKDREIHKTYTALVVGHPDKKGVINFPIARDQVVRNKMAHVAGGRDSETSYEVQEYYEKNSLVHAYPVTGRTHQIRVHFSVSGYPLVGDKLYGIASHLLSRQALHASKLEFVFEGKQYSFESVLPKDFLECLKKLKPFA